MAQVYTESPGALAYFQAINRYVLLGEKFVVERTLTGGVEFPGGGGGSGGGGGATGEWERLTRKIRKDLSPREYDLVVLITGDRDCPASGVWHIWRPALYDFGDGGGPRLYDRRVNQTPGDFVHFWGYQQGAGNHPWAPPWSSTPGAPPDYASWTLTDNCPPLDADKISAGPKPCGTPVVCPANGAPCELRNQDITRPSGDVQYEVWLSSQGATAGVSNCFYRQTIGTIWWKTPEPCTPETSTTYAIPRDRPRRADRRRQIQSPPDDIRDPKRDREGPPGLPLGVLPPFSWGQVVSPTAPRGPSVSEGGSRPPRPPRRQERQRKPRGLSILLGAINFVSETAEVVDCAYKSLPKDVRRRWEKGRKPKESRGLLDQAGQYGIDGADWKGPALYHNYKKIDWEAALKCVAANQVEDMIIGQLMRKKGFGATAGVVGRMVDEQKEEQQEREDRAKWARIRRENAARIEAGRRARASH